MRRFLVLHLSLFLLICVASMPPISAAADGLPALDKAAAEKISFRKDVWPIVKRHCWGCHSGMDAKGGLSMDSVTAMLKGGDSGGLFEPGKPDDSLLVEMITGDEPAMPQKQPPLSMAKINILRGWILAGAKDDSRPGDTQPSVKIPRTYKFAPAINSLSISPDGKFLAAACRSEVVVMNIDGDPAPRRLPTECDLLTHVEFSADGQLLVAIGGSPSRYGEVRFFNPADGKLIAARRVGHDTLFRGSFAPDSKAVATGGSDGAVHIVPVNPKAKVRAFSLHSDWVLDVAYTPDGKMLITGGRDKATKVCSVETGRLLRTIDMSSELVTAVASTAEFAFSSGKARTLNGFEYKIALQGIEVTGAGNGSRPVSRRNQYVKGMESQPGQVFDISLSGDRKTLAIAGAYDDVRVYKTADRQRVALIGNIPAPVYSVTLNADGSRLAVGSKSGKVLLYEVPSGKQLKSIAPVPVATQDVAAK